VKLILGRLSLPLIYVLVLHASVSGAQTTVCIEVQTKEWKRTEEPSTSQRSEAGRMPPPAEGSPGQATATEQEPPAGPVQAEPSAVKAAPAPGASAAAPGESASVPAPGSAPGIGQAASSTAGASAQPPASIDRSQPRVRYTDGATQSKAPEIDPTLYLKRMLEYEVTHEPGFAAVERGCSERITVELYALDEGWTMFARYSGNEREEKVDRVQLDEFVALSQRVARSLLYDTPISATVNRENVLRADSQEKLRSMQGRHHFILGLGTMLRVGVLGTEQGANAPAQAELRFATPLSLQVGSRHKLRAWGLDAFIRANVGTSTTSSADNLLGGHVDYVGGGGVGLRFLRYVDAIGISSLYYAVGADFELAVFRGIEPGPGTTHHDEELVGGGLNLGAILGYEFLRSSATHFFVQAELIVPTYVYSASERYTEVDTWLPGTVAIVGMAL
jgi:hypothetical protein